LSRRVYLCRHGETEFNRIGRRQGQVDSPLTARGQAQAEAMGRGLVALVGPDFRIYSSPLGRAHQSSRFIALALGGAEITLDPRLMEISMGAWDGKTDAEIRASHPEISARHAGEALWFNSPDGETYDTFAARLRAAMAEIWAAPQAISVVVAHGVVGRVIRAQHHGLTPAQSLSLTVPQDGFFELTPDGSSGFIPAA
jgi:broad specificity phosphatase PhoE